MTPLQCRVARAALDISQGELGAIAGVSRGVVSDFERSKRQTISATFAQIEIALQESGVYFLPWRSGKTGVSFYDEKPE